MVKVVHLLVDLATTMSLLMVMDWRRAEWQSKSFCDERMRISLRVLMEEIWTHVQLEMADEAVTALMFEVHFSK